MPWNTTLRLAISFYMKLILYMQGPLCMHDELEILRQHYRELLSVLPGQALAPKMLTEDYLTYEDYQSVMSSGSPSQQNLIILSSMQRRPCGWVDRLCALLQDCPGGEFSYLIENLLQSKEKETARSEFYKIICSLLLLSEN